MKKLVSVLLVLAMLFTMAPISSMAQNASTPTVDLENIYLGEVFVAVNGDPSYGDKGAGETFTVNNSVQNDVQDEVSSEEAILADLLSAESGAQDAEMYLMTEEEMEQAVLLANNSSPVEYVVGDTMTRRISDDAYGTRTTNFECVAVGTHCTIWREVRDNPVAGLTELTTEAANEIVNEFDGRYAEFCNFVGDVDYIDSDKDGKIAILCYDIDSTFENTTGDKFYGGYTLGYFWGADLAGSNGTALDCIHIDTFPVMSKNFNKQHQLENVSKCFSTLFHELQHYAWQSNRGMNNGSVRANESFYNEGISMAVQHALYGYQSTADRIRTFNTVQQHSPGRALKWYGMGAEDYGHAYLFSQYLRTRYSQMVRDGADGATLFKKVYTQIAESQNNNNIVGAYADILYPTSKYPELTSTDERVAKLYLDFWIATYLKADSGEYGFAGEEFANSVDVVSTIKNSVPETSSAIYNGGAVFYYVNNKKSGSVDVNEAASGPNMEFAAINSAGKTRDIVLLLDYSGSMNSNQIKSLKEAAKSFCEQTCDGTNTRVSVIRYDTRPYVVCDLTEDKGQLINAINNLPNYSLDLTYMAEALDKAESVLSSSTADKQIIILMTDGVPNGRSQNTTNRYPSYPSYSAVYETADNMINTYEQNGKDMDIYTLGFYSYSYNNSLAEKLLEDIANIDNNEGTYVKVIDTNDLIFTFAEFGSGQKSTGEKIRIEIACPVEVKLAVNCENIVEMDENGELVIYDTVEYLDSTDPTHAASFGTIEVTGSGSSTHVVLNVDRYNDYQLTVKGTASGYCDINVVGSDGTRKFDNIPLQSGTTISGNMNLHELETSNEGILLDIDSDGDGQTDDSVTSVDTLRDTYTINYYVDGVLYQNKTWKAGTAIIPIDAPVKDGYTFVKWNGLPDVMPQKNINVNALYSDNCVVTPIATPAGGTYDSVQTVELSTTTADATIYYTLDGSVPTVASTLYTQPVAITGSGVLKAIAVKDGMDDSRIMEETYTLSTFALNLGETENGTISADTTSATGGQVVTLTATPKSGYKLKEWASSNGGTFDNSKKATTTFTMPANDTTITATFTKKSTGGGGGGGGGAPTTYTVKFETNGGSKISNKSVPRNDKVAVPAEPTKEDFVFDGWYKDKNFKTAYDFDSKVTAAITLYAKWVPASEVQIILTIGKKEAIVFGKEVVNDVAPMIVKSRTMLPIRFIAEALGAEVLWNAEKMAVTVKKDDVEIVIAIGSDEATVNGEKVKLDSAAFIENSRTYLPLRFISENLGAKVEWVDKTQEVIITK